MMRHHHLIPWNFKRPTQDEVNLQMSLLNEVQLLLVAGKSKIFMYIVTELFKTKSISTFQPFCWQSTAWNASVSKDSRPLQKQSETAFLCLSENNLGHKKQTSIKAFETLLTSTQAGKKEK